MYTMYKQVSRPGTCYFFFFLCVCARLINLTSASFRCALRCVVASRCVNKKRDISLYAAAHRVSHCKTPGETKKKHGGVVTKKISLPSLAFVTIEAGSLPDWVSGGE